MNIFKKIYFQHKDDFTKDEFMNLKMFEIQQCSLISKSGFAGENLLISELANRATQLI